MNVSATIDAVIIDNKDLSGKWVNLKSKKELTANLSINNLKEIDRHNRYLLEVITLTRFVKIDLSEHFEYKPIIDKYFILKERNNLNAILLVSYPSKGEYTENGYCGAGIEQFIIFLSINELMESSFSQIVQINSCLKDIISNVTIDTHKEYNIFDLGEFDLNNFDKFKLEVVDNKKTSIYELNSKNIEFGLIKVE